MIMEKDEYFEKLKIVQEKDYLTISDAAILLSVTRQTIYNWIDDGVIKGKRISNKKVLISRKEINALFDDNRSCEKAIK